MSRAGIPVCISNDCREAFNDLIQRVRQGKDWIRKRDKEDELGNNDNRENKEERVRDKAAQK